MALVKETGAVVAGANTYVALTDADTYHELRGNTAWLDGDDDAKEASLIKATQQMEARYRTGWNGKKSVGTQPLSWPRISVYDEDGYEFPELTVPQAVKDAQCEIAALLLAGSSFVQSEVTADDSSVVSESVGPISVSYSKTASQLVSVFPLIDQMLAPYASVGVNKMSFRPSLTEDEIIQFAISNGTFNPANYPEYFDNA